MRVASGPGRRLAAVRCYPWRQQEQASTGWRSTTAAHGDPATSGPRRKTTGQQLRGPAADVARFGEASVAGLFEAAGARVTAVGVRTPRVYLLDRTLAVYRPAEIALVEDVRGGTLEQWLERGDPGAQQALPRLAAALGGRARIGCRGRHIGRVARRFKQRRRRASGPNV